MHPNTGLLKSAFLLPQAAQFLWVFGEKAGAASFFTKHPQKTSEQPKAARTLEQLLRSPVAI
jgi:hypothetical protein